MKRFLNVSLSCFCISLAFLLTGCPPQPSAPPEAAKPPQPAAPVAETIRAAQGDVDLALRRIASIPTADFAPKPRTIQTLRIASASLLTAEDIRLFARLHDLETLYLNDYRELNDETAVLLLKDLKKLKSIGFRNCMITDETTKLIAANFPNLQELDLSLNSRLTNASLREIAKLTSLRRLTLINCGFDDIGAMNLDTLVNLNRLDIRGNMQIGNMGLGVIAKLPKLQVLQHRSSSASNDGVEALAGCADLDFLEMQDFDITGETGPMLNAIPKLKRLDVFRCQSFDSEGLLALKGKPLTRLKLRDLPMINDEGTAVFKEMPALKELILQELPSVSDEGLAGIADLKELEMLDIWYVPVGDETVQRIAALPKLKTLSLRETEITDAAIDLILGMPSLEQLTVKTNNNVSVEALKKLATKKFKKLDISDESAGGEE